MKYFRYYIIIWLKSLSKSRTELMCPDEMMMKWHNTLEVNPMSVILKEFWSDYIVNVT